MTEKKVNKQQEHGGVLEHLLQHRLESAAIFPHSDADTADYLEHYQGVKLSKASQRALKRI